MTSWEDRMAARAAERQRRADEQERVRAAAGQAAYEARLQVEHRAEFEAGPPGGCHDCYAWIAGTPWGYPAWWHGPSVQPGPAPPDAPEWMSGVPDSDWCWHPCHGGEAPVFCGPVAFAAGGLPRIRRLRGGPEHGTGR